MKITLNNREEDFKEDRLTVEEMLNLKKFTFKMRIVKINGRLIPKDEYHNTAINNGDNVQMLYLMSGG